MKAINMKTTEKHLEAQLKLAELPKRNQDVKP